MPGLVSTGVKRKHHALDEGGGGDAKADITGCGGDHHHGGCGGGGCCPTQPRDKCSSYTMQRKYVMNASICKLKATCNLIDPSLRRSVLIRNTLLHIDQELRTEGQHQDAFQLSTFIASTQSPCTDTADKDRLPGAAEPSGAFNSPREPGGALCREPLHSKDSSAKVFYAHPENPLSRTSNHCANSSLSSLSATPTLSSLSSVHSTAATSTVLAVSSTHAASTFTNSELSKLSLNNSEILDFGDELFSDIDVSLYDFDLASPFVSSHRPSPSFLTPVSCSSSSSSCDEWLRPDTGDFSFCSDMNSATTTTTTTTSQGNSCRSDIACDELDQIMHVLVDVGM